MYLYFFLPRSLLYFLSPSLPPPSLSPFQSFRYSPTNIEVISWLGAYHMDSQFPDKAIHYFERAALIQYATRMMSLLANHMERNLRYKRHLCISHQSNIQLLPLKEDNLSIMDEMMHPTVSIMRRFHCMSTR